MKSALIVAAAAFAIAGCSGGAKTSTTTGGTAALSDLLVSVATSQADGMRGVTGDTAKITVTAVDAQRNVLLRRHGQHRS